LWFKFEPQTLFILLCCYRQHCYTPVDAFFAIPELSQFINWTGIFHFIYYGLTIIAFILSNLFFIMTPSTKTDTNLGRITQIIGPVIDVAFAPEKNA